MRRAARSLTVQANSGESKSLKIEWFWLEESILKDSSLNDLHEQHKTFVSERVNSCITGVAQLSLLNSDSGDAVGPDPTSPSIKKSKKKKNQPGSLNTMRSGQVLGVTH